MQNTNIKELATELLNEIRPELQKEIKEQTNFRVQVEPTKVEIVDTKNVDPNSMLIYAKLKNVLDGENVHETLVKLAENGDTNAKAAIKLLVSDTSKSFSDRDSHKASFENVLRNKSFSLSDITSGAGLADVTADPTFGGFLTQGSTFLSMAGIQVRNFINGAVRVNAGKSTQIGVWIGTEPIPENSFEFKQLEITQKKCAGFVAISNDMIRENVGEALRVIRQQLSENIPNGIDKGFYVGTGSNNEPVGIFNISGVKSVAATGTPDASKIGKDLLKAKRYMASANVNPRNPYWIMNPATWIDIISQTDANSNVIWYAKDGAERNSNVLLGIPVIVSNFVPDTKLGLFDASRIVVGQGFGLTVESSAENKFVEDQTLVKAISMANVGLVHKEAGYIITGVNTWA